MGFIDELLSSAKIVVDKAGKQTDKVLEISKLKYQSIQLQNELSHLYEQLGVATYAKMVQEADNGDLIASLGDEITEVRAALEVVEEKISEQKNLRTCPNCGAKLPVRLFSAPAAVQSWKMMRMCPRMMPAAAAMRNAALPAARNAAPMRSRPAAAAKRLWMKRKRLRDAVKRIPLPVRRKNAE